MRALPRAGRPAAWLLLVAWSTIPALGCTTDPGDTGSAAGLDGVADPALAADADVDAAAALTPVERLVGYADPMLSPINHHPGSFADGTRDHEAYRQLEVERQIELERAIADCMEARGFTYEVHVDDIDGDPPAGTPGSEIWVDRHGYGVSTGWFDPDQVGAGLVGMPQPDWIMDLLEAMTFRPDDANAAIVESLAPEEQTAYEAALGASYPEEPEGCLVLAFDAQTVDLSAVDRIADRFGPELADVEQSIATDVRLVNEEDRLSACVEDQGITFRTPGELRAEWADDLDELDLVPPVTGSSFDEDEEQTDDEDDVSLVMSDEELAALAGPPPALTDDARTQLAELQEQELALAAAAWDCGLWDRTAGIWHDVVSEHQQVFVDRYRDGLVELLQE